MQNSLTLCHSLQLKSEKELLLFLQRHQHSIPGTPRLLIQHHEHSNISVFTEPLLKVSLTYLKQLNSNDKAFGYAQTIITACVKLTPIYGLFMINENMVFMNNSQEMFVWINPNYLENQVKIYVPPNAEGQKTMVRSIVSFLKMWLRCDFGLLSQAQHLTEMLTKLQPVKARTFELFRPKITPQIAANRSASVNFDHPAAKRFQTTRFGFNNPRGSDDSTRKNIRPQSPDQQSEPQQILSPSSINSVTKAAIESIKQKIKNRTTLNSSKQADNSDNSESRGVITLNSTSLHTQAKTTFTRTIGINSYFPNKTTSNKNHIVQMILQHDTDPNNFGKNNILLDQEKLMELERMKVKQLKESLHGIGQEVNDLFQSSIMEEPPRMDVSGINRQFESLLK